MADSNIPIQPVSPTGAPVPTLALQSWNTTDINGNPITMQSTVEVDDSGRVVVPMTENTGREILEVLRELLSITVQAQGIGFMPTKLAGGFATV